MSTYLQATPSLVYVTIKVLSTSRPSWSLPSHPGGLSNATQKHGVPSSMIVGPTPTALGRVAVATPTMNIKRQILLAGLPALVVTIIAALVVFFLLSRLRILKGEQALCQIPPRSDHQKPRRLRSSFGDHHLPLPSSFELETPRLPPPVQGRFYERFSQPWIPMPTQPTMKFHQELK